MIGFIALLLFFILFLIGTPVSFSMGLAALVGLSIRGAPLRVLPQQIIAGIESFQMLAVPFFILAAQIMNAGEVTERLFDFANELIGWVRGGLAYVNVLASMIFAGISGAAVADASGLGLVEIKAMKDAGFDDTFAVAVTASSSMIGPIIPPSIIMIIYGHIAGISIASLFLAGILPGILAGLLLMFFIYILVVTGRVKGGRTHKISIKRILKSFYKNFLVLLLPPLLLWSIISGIVTPTEAGVLASIYSFILSCLYRGTDFLKEMPNVLLTTMKNTGVILFIVGTTTALVWVLTREQTAIFISRYFFALSDNKYVILILINIFLLVVGAMLNQIPALLIVVPLLSPMSLPLGIHPVHFGLIVVFNLMIGMITPPFGMGLYIMSSITDVPIHKVINACLPFLIPLLVALALVTYIPFLSLWLPTLLLWN